MARKASIIFEEYSENCINGQIGTRNYKSICEIIRTFLRYFEQKANQFKELYSAWALGEISRYMLNFNRTQNIKRLDGQSQ